MDASIPPALWWPLDSEAIAPLAEPRDLSRRLALAAIDLIDGHHNDPRIAIAGRIMATIAIINGPQMQRAH